MKTTQTKKELNHTIMLMAEEIARLKKVNAHLEHQKRELIEAQKPTSTKATTPRKVPTPPAKGVVISERMYIKILTDNPNHHTHTEWFNPDDMLCQAKTIKVYNADNILMATNFTDGGFINSYRSHNVEHRITTKANS